MTDSLLQLRQALAVRIDETKRFSAYVDNPNPTERAAVKPNERLAVRVAERNLQLASDAIDALGRLSAEPSKPNVIYSKRASGTQRVWLQKFYDQTGFDAMYQDEYDRELLDFDELMRKNCEWLEGHNIESLHIVQRYP